jgi:ATP-binding cassette subfamily F protein uup
VFLVSHDRSFLDNVVTSTIVFEGDGRWREYEGGVEDWLTQSRRASSLAAQAPSMAQPVKPPARSAKPPSSPKRKPSYKEQRELEMLPGVIEALEREQKAIHDELADGSLYVRDSARAATLAQRSAQIDDELMAALERWEALGSPPS